MRKHHLVGGGALLLLLWNTLVGSFVGAFVSIVHHHPRRHTSLLLLNAKNQKDRGEEMLRLAQQMKVSVPKLKQVLIQKRKKLTPSSEKAQYIDWILMNNGKVVVEASKQQQQVNNVKETTAATKTPATTTAGSTKRIRPKRPASLQEKDQERKAQARARQQEALQDPTLLTNVKFAERTDLHPSSKRAITEVLGLKEMTEIQSKTFAAASSGKDILGRARTGTGKTLAFLIPAVEQILQSPTFRPGKSIGCLVISPTRELATQIGDQAEKLLTYHSDLSVQVMYGGTKKGRDISLLTKRLPAILVATPGRLLDHLQETKLGGRQFGNDIMATTGIVVLDETDRLLDMGFRREIGKIFSYLPRQEKRQTLLFSATIPKELKSIMAENMRKDYVEVDCIQDGDAAQHTNSRVNQAHVVLPTMDRFLSSVLEIVLKAMQEDEESHKIVVFFPTARLVGFFAEFFNRGLNIPVIELHSKKSQSYRNKASDKFRNTKRGILFTSDVSARGVDYPDVTKVIQFGIPESRDQYIHRLGRTGRAGKNGQGLLVLCPFESMFLSELKGLDVPRDEQIMEILSNPVDPDASDLIEPALERIKSGDAQLTPSAQRAYTAFLGYYLGQMKRTQLNSREQLVGIANRFSSTLGLNQVPPIPKRTVGKMGLKGIAGIVVGEPETKHHKGPRTDHVDGQKAPRGRRRNNR